jgi:predicted nucleotidyltransferase
MALRVAVIRGKVCFSPTIPMKRATVIKDTLAHHKPELYELCRRFRVRRLELFGSAATGRHLPEGSDLDFLVEFATLSPGSYADTYFDFREALENLFDSSVDLVVASAIKNPYFRQSVEESKVLLYAA